MISSRRAPTTRSRLRVTRLLVIGLLGLLFTGSVATTTAGPASACSCGVLGSPADAVSRASGVFIARPTDKVSDGFTDIYEFSVTGVFKGDVGATTTVGTLAGGNGCGTSYRLGQEYLMFVSRPRDVHAAWEGSACGPGAGGTFDVRAVTEQVFGAPRPPSDSGSTRTITWWTRTTAAVPATAIVLGGVALLGLVWMTVVIVRRRRD